MSRVLWPESFSDLVSLSHNNPTLEHVDSLTLN